MSWYHRSTSLRTRTHSAGTRVLPRGGFLLLLFVELRELRVEVLGRLDAHARQDAVEPLRDPPVPVPQQLHRRRHENQSDDRRVEEHGDREAESEELDGSVVAEHEGTEHEDQVP